MLGGAQVMQCMEVWGGNQVVDNSVSMLGLDAWVYSQPFQDGRDGGDVYYVSSCATGRITRLLVADVSGHGAPVARMAAQLRALMRQFVNRIEQESFVASMSRQFSELSGAGHFATAIVTTFFAPTRRLTLFNAGHPAPLIYRMKEHRWKLLEARDERGRRTNLPLGIDIEGIDEPAHEEMSLTLDVGDLVLCYTDALIESRDALGEMLGEEGLLELVRTLNVTDVPGLLHELNARIVERQTPQDDVTMLLFRPSGLPARLPLSRRLLAPFRVMSGVVGALLHRRPPPLPEMSVPNIGGALIDSLNKSETARQR